MRTVLRRQRCDVERAVAPDVVLDVMLANSFLARFCGLMLRQPLAHGQALLITRCASVHGAFMRCAIDIVYLDASGNVVECVPHLQPWRVSISAAGLLGSGRARHVLELATGSIARLGIAPGDRLLHPLWHGPEHQKNASPVRRGDRETGSAMIEFTIIGPLITLLGLALLQYAMLFLAKNQINHAGFMAARAGAMANADLGAVRSAYAQALVPLYGGGSTPAALAASLARAEADLGQNGVGNVKIDLLNPIRESFDDWNDPQLQAALATLGKRVIPNAGQAFRNQEIGASSGQTLQDANLIKLRITQGYQPKIPLINTIYATYLIWLDTGSDPFHSKLVQSGRIPVVTDVTLHMQSDAIEAPASAPGSGSDPVEAGPPDGAAGPAKPAPHCRTIRCSDGADGGNGSDPAPACNPLIDPTRCMTPECGAQSCCASTRP